MPRTTDLRTRALENVNDAIERVRSRTLEGVNEGLERTRERAVEVGLYLPLGAYVAVRDQIADLDSKRVRKLFDDLVARGQGRVEPIEKVVRRRSREFEREFDKTATEARKTVTRSSKKTAKRAEAATAKAQTKLPRVATPKRASDLPIAGYASLTADEILTEIRGLTQTDLAKIYKFEKANENRKTILDAIDARIQVLPIPTYDALTVDEIVGKLEGLDASELRTLRRYEADTKERTTILEKIDSLL